MGKEHGALAAHLRRTSPLRASGRIRSLEHRYARTDPGVWGPVLVDRCPLQAPRLRMPRGAPQTRSSLAPITAPCTTARARYPASGAAQTVDHVAPSRQQRPRNQIASRQRPWLLRGRESSVRHCRRRIARCLTWLAVGTLSMGLWGRAMGDEAYSEARDYWASPVVASGDVPEADSPATRDLSPGHCAVCHPRQFREWRDSLHAKAMSPGVLAQLRSLSSTQRRECLSCHMPRADLQEAWEQDGLKARGRFQGVDCAACHVREQRRYGPRDVEITSHGPVVGAGFFSQPAFCAPCHQFGSKGVRLNGKLLENTVEEWRSSRYAREGRSCQGCHMSGGSHRFAGIHDPETTARAIQASAVRTRAGVELRVDNVGAGHALPTYSVPRIRILFNGPKGVSVPRLEHVIQRHLDWDPNRGWRELSDTRLLPGHNVSLSLPLAAGEPTEVVFVVEPDADYAERVYPALADMLADQATAEERDLLAAASRRAKASPYVLLRIACGAWKGQALPCTRSGENNMAPSLIGEPDAKALAHLARRFSISTDAATETTDD